MSMKCFRLLGVLIVLVALIDGCANRPYLNINYSVPPRSQYLNGQSVRIQVQDSRKTQAVMEPRALRVFPDFQDRYSLAWIMPNRQRLAAGEYDLAALFKQTFKKRLERLGANVVGDENAGVPLLRVDINTVRLKLIGVKWYATISCTAGLIVDERRVAGETVSGNAERVRVVGRKGADLLLSNTFTDVVNRIDMAKLFHQANLL